MKTIVNILLGFLFIASRAAPVWAGTTNDIRIVELQGVVELSPKGATTWVLTQTNQIVHPFDRLRTGPDSRVALRWSDQSAVPIGALTELEILPPREKGDESGLQLVRGIISFFHRDKPGRIRVITRGATAGIEGTEFVMEVAATNDVERTTLSVIEGKVEFGNAAATLVLTNGEQAVAAPGEAPRRTPGFIARNLLQWCFYYPAVLDLNDLSLTTEEQSALGESLAAYRQGDLLTALKKFPATAEPDTEAQRVYHAALLLSVGQVEKTGAQLSELRAAGVSEKNQRLAGALHQLIAAVQHEPLSSTINHQPSTPTELLAASYYAQSLAGPGALKAALDFARRAAAGSPEFGFAWERVAELEFSFGRTERALAALNQSLALAPRNAQALALNGFLLAAQNKTGDAIGWFDRALVVDSALGNAWLGRGLCRIRRGDGAGGREDLLIAAALEPQRAASRSYLGKAWSTTGDDRRARKEFQLAQTLDPNDPTSWLYSALNDEQHNRINAAVRDLEKSQELNQNRGVYRSGLLLDQDRAVRSANLARIYSEAGLDDVALREAGRAVASVYANFSSHLFLANSYQQLRGASPFGERYETPAFGEYLLAALLGPADGRLLAQPVSQQEYSRMFERDGLGFSSETEYLSRGAWRQYAVQYGNAGGTSYALEAEYASDPGQAANAQLETRVFSAKVKQALTQKDSVMVQVYDTRFEGGDVGQHYDPRGTSQKTSFTEHQSPNVLLGYHREWSPDSHTLLLASRIDDASDFHVPNAPAMFLVADPIGSSPLAAAATDLTRTAFRRYIASSVELQQIQRFNSHTWIVGTRLQSNSERTSVQDAVVLDNGNLNGGEFSILLDSTPFTFPRQNVRVENGRTSFYVYDYWHVLDSLQLFGGVSLDYLHLARNTIAPPLSTKRDRVSAVSPKAGLLWEPCKEVAVRLGYGRSLNGQDLDQSIRLEPANFSGLPFTFRTAFPDALVGGLSGERTKVWQADGRFRLGCDNYLVVAWQHLESKMEREIGAYNLVEFADPQPQISHTREGLHFREDSFQVSIRHLFGESFSVGAKYQLSRAKLDQMSAVQPSLFIAPTHGTSFREGMLQSVNIDGLTSFPNGLFAGASVAWYCQSDLTDTTLSGRLPGENFWQFNLQAGYRSPRRHFECTVGLLNVTGTDYRLHPINSYLDLPRKRTLAVMTRFNF